MAKFSPLFSPKCINATSRGNHLLLFVSDSSALSAPSHFVWTFKIWLTWYINAVRDRLTRQAACFLQLWAIFMLPDLHIPQLGTKDQTFGHLEFFNNPARDAYILYFIFCRWETMCDVKSPLAISSSFLSVDQVRDTFLFGSENANSGMWRCLLSLQWQILLFFLLFPILCKVCCLNLKQDLLLCCCCNIVQRLMTACQPWFAHRDGCGLSEETSLAQQHVHDVHVLNPAWKKKTAGADRCCKFFVTVWNSGGVCDEWDLRTWGDT